MKSLIKIQKKMYKEIMDNYTQNEISSLLDQKARKIRTEVSNRMFIRLLIMLLPFLIYSISLHANDITNICANGNGAAWKCNNCRTYQWQASNNKDWRGDYHCNSCGHKK